MVGHADGAVKTSSIRRLEAGHGPTGCVRSQIARQPSAAKQSGVIMDWKAVL